MVLIKKRLSNTSLDSLSFKVDVMKKFSINLDKKHKIIVMSVMALILVASIVLAIVAFVIPPKTPELSDTGARLVLDCGIRVVFEVDDEFNVKSVSACEKKYEKYIEDINPEMDLTACIYHIFGYAIDEGYIDNSIYSSVLVSTESGNTQLYDNSIIGVNDIMSENMMEQIYCYGIAITEYDPEIQRTANLNNVPYSIVYICKMLEENNEGLSAKELMKYSFSEIVQMANNANGGDRNYMYHFLTDLTEQNVKMVK